MVDNNQKITFKDLIQNQNNFENFVNPYSINTMNQIPLYPSGYCPSFQNQNLMYGMINAMNSEQIIQYQNQIMANQNENKINDYSILNNQVASKKKYSEIAVINENPKIIKVLEKMDDTIISDSIYQSRLFCFETFIADSFLKLSIKCEEELQNWEMFFEYFPLNDFSLNRFCDISRKYIRFFSTCHFWITKKYLNWIEKYTKDLINFLKENPENPLKPKELQTYLTFYKQIILECFEYKEIVSLNEFAPFTISKKPPSFANCKSPEHNCLDNNCTPSKKFDFPNIIYMIKNFKRIFLDGKKLTYLVLNKLGNNQKILNDLLNSLMNIIENIQFNSEVKEIESIILLKLWNGFGEERLSIQGKGDLKSSDTK